METQNILGIYISKRSATALCVNLHGKSPVVAGCFSVSIPRDESKEDQNSFSELAGLIVQGCNQRQLKFSSAHLAIDSSVLMQYNIHSEFQDMKQITATIRFDTEEVVATDISNQALAFTVTGSDDRGSKLAVFTIEKKILSDVISSFQSKGIDPVTVEPDICGLVKFLSNNPSGSSYENSLYGIVSGDMAYLAMFGQGIEARILRAFLINSGKDRNQLISRQLLSTIASADVPESIENIRIFDSNGSIDCSEFTQTLGINTTSMDFMELSAVEKEVLADCNDEITFAIAYGAALGQQKKSHHVVNFRDDYLPFQGTRRRLEKMCKILSMAAAVLIVAFGAYFQFKLSKINSPIVRLKEKFSKEYEAVMLGKQFPGDTGEAATRIKKELERIERVKKGLVSASGEQSIIAKLTQLLESFNQCASRIDLNVDKITITGKSIRLTGDTSSRANTLVLREAIEASALEIEQDELQEKNNRDYFNFVIVVAKS